MKAKLNREKRFFGGDLFKKGTIVDVEFVENRTHPVIKTKRGYITFITGEYELILEDTDMRELLRRINEEYKQDR